jgi:Dyp-type peroxidase family
VKQSSIIVVVPFAGRLAQRVTAVLDSLGNPAVNPVRHALDEAEFVHFMSMSVIHDSHDDVAHLLIEASADGSATTALSRIAATIEPELLDVLRAAERQIPAQGLGAFLENHRRNVGPGWFSTSGVTFNGTLELSVPRIRKEAHFAAWVSDWLEKNPAREPTLMRLERLRHEVFRHVDLKWAFLGEPALPKGHSTAGRLLPIALSAVRELLWPLLIVALIVAFRSAFVHHHGLLRVIAYFFGTFIGLSFVLFVILSVVYCIQRWHEKKDISDETPAAAHVQQIMERENRAMQNHVLGVSTLRFGGRLLLRFSFWLVGTGARYTPRPGFLSNIGTIHFASWLLLPRTRTLVFLSNYDGSWLSYLEDFIAQAHLGLTAIWSNTRGFPRTTGLWGNGANDGERFKRWSRRQQCPTRFWYTAYPHLTTERIRKNALIRHGFASATNEKSAAEWLTHLGFPPPGTVQASSKAAKSADSTPPQDIEDSQVPTLVFGGLSRLRHAHCLIVRLRDDRDACRTWLRGIRTTDSYGKYCLGETHRLAFGFTVSGLKKIGLDPAVVAMFPSAFVHGMAAPWRSRALGDTGINSPENWSWGSEDKKCDAILVVYADCPDTLKTSVVRYKSELEAHGHNPFRELALTDGPEEGKPLREPFGFIDGISQPIIRCTSSQTPPNPVDVVAAGELVLGYDDNRGYKAPTPRAGEFDVGANGTFLVVRQLDQDPERFEKYLREEADRLAEARNHDPRVPYDDKDRLREWIAAKMVGRWRVDGTSTMKNPDGPGGGPPDKGFRFDADPHGLGCPYGSHIRRANPRDSLAPGSQDQIDITNQHRVLRVGRPYGPQNGSRNPGLLFMCVNTDIEGQFEFLQQTWVLGRSFHGLEDEFDHVVGQCQSQRREFMSIPTRYGPLRLRRMKDFVTMRGGGYFFMPSRAALDFLSQH